MNFKTFLGVFPSPIEYIHETAWHYYNYEADYNVIVSRVSIALSTRQSL